LKQNSLALVESARCVAPVSAPGRGLKPRGPSMNTKLEMSPRCPHRGAD